MGTIPVSPTNGLFSILFLELPNNAGLWSCTWQGCGAVERLGAVTCRITTCSMAGSSGERFLEWAPEELDLRSDSDFSHFAPNGVVGNEEASVG